FNGSFDFNIAAEDVLCGGIQFGHKFPLVKPVLPAVFSCAPRFDEARPALLNSRNAMSTMRFAAALPWHHRLAAAREFLGGISPDFAERRMIMRHAQKI